MMVIRVPISTRTYGNLNGRSMTQRSGATLRGDRSMLPISRVDDPIRLMTVFGTKRTSRDVCYLSAFGGKADISRDCQPNHDLCVRALVRRPRPTARTGGGP